MEKVAIVTGGTRGIGKAIVYELVKKGIKVVFTYKESLDLAKSIKDDLKNDVEYFKCDATKREDVKSLACFVLDKYKTIDILVNNAGISHGERLFTDIVEDEWDDTFNVNVKSVYFLTQEVLPTFINKKDGCIINISSVYGLTGGSCEVDYSASKAAINGLTKALAKELGPSNIRVNAIAPGAIETDMTKDLTEEEWEGLLDESLLKRKGEPQDIAKCVSFLIDDTFMTGQIISPNGGWVIT